MKYKAIKKGCVSTERRQVNFVIFVVNGLSVLKSMDSDEDADRQHTELIASAFNCPYVSFRGIKIWLSFYYGIFFIFWYIG